MKERMMIKDIISDEYKKFLDDLKSRVATSRYQAALSANSVMIHLYHHIGSQILEAQANHGWGAKIIEQLSRDLKMAFPDMKGFSPQNLKYMKRFATEYPSEAIGQQAVDQLPWGHNIVLMYEIKDLKERAFYIQKTRKLGWARDVLSMQIESNLYQREGKAITNFSVNLAQPHSDLAKATLRNPHMFDFLSLGKKASEREVEKGLIEHIERFLLELGEGFAFLGSQYHLQIEDQDFYLDMLFYHLKLRSFLVGVLAEYALRDLNKPIGLAEYRLTEQLPKEMKTLLPSIEELEVELSRELNKTTME